MATQVSLTDGAVASAGALAIQTNGTTQAVSISTGQVATLAQNPILTSGTANGVAYLNGSKAVTSGSALVFDGTNLGVGVTPSAWGLGKAMEIGYAGNGLWGVQSSGDMRITANTYYDGTNYKLVSGGSYASYYRQSNGIHSWLTSTGTTAGNATFTQAMTLDASGNLGVGATSPSARLHVQDSSGGTVGTVWLGSATYYGTIQHDGAVTGANIYTVATASGGGHIFKRGSTEQMRIDSSGSLLVAGTSTSGINSGGGFYVNSNSLNTYTMISHVTGSASGSPYSYFYYANSYLGQISQSGTTGVNYTSASDYRLKNITGPVTGAKDFIMALQPKQGTWKSDGSKFVGFLAHEFQEVSPSSVSGEKDAVDADGTPIYQSMQASSSEVMANLIALVQEQQALITQLQADVALLKGA